MKKYGLYLSVFLAGVILTVMIYELDKKEYRVETYVTEINSEGNMVRFSVDEELMEQLEKANLDKYIVFHNEAYTYLSLTKRQKEQLSDLWIITLHDLRINEKGYDKKDFKPKENLIDLGL